MAGEPSPDDTGVLDLEDTGVHEAVPPERAPVPPPTLGPGPPRGRFAADSPWPWLLLVLVVVVGLLVWLALGRGRGGEQRTVPAAVGLPQHAAVARLTRAGYDVAVVRAPSRRGRGIVFGQRPGDGTRLAKGQTVTIEVANGSRPAARSKLPASPTTATTSSATTAASLGVPAVTGQPLAAAGGAVEAAGLVPDSYPVPSGKPAGAVVAQSPAGGTSLPTGGTVRLNVSTGTGGGTVTVPDVTGRSAAEARAALWSAQLTVRTVYAHAPKPAEIGRVLAETGAGSAARAWSQVAITVGR